MTVQPRLASTVMLLRDLPSGQPAIEVFMVRRVVQSEFMPDIYVFPGGSVSADDRLAEQAQEICRDIAISEVDPQQRTALGSGVRAAAIRELFEEANVLLAYDGDNILAINEVTRPRFASYRQAFNERKGSLIELARSEQLVLATDRLAYFAHWITPEGMPKRFDTHFFLATAPAEQEAIYDQLETSEGIWIQPAEALALFSEGEIPIAFPTYHQLHDLANFNSVDKVLQASATRYVPTYTPLMVYEDGRPQVYLPENPSSVWKL